MAISLKTLGTHPQFHIDFCGPFRNHMYLIELDAYSKWPKVIRMSSSTSTSETTKVLLGLFYRHGLPDKLVSGTGLQFTSDEFKEFVSNNGILHIKTAPYHPQTNGKAECFVQTLQNFIKRVDHDKSMNQRQIDEAILKFLMTYRCTPHSGTEFTPSYLMLSRQIKNVFDLLRTKTSKIEINNLRGPTPFEDMIFYLRTDSNEICTAYVKLKINHILFLKIFDFRFSF